jgi:hypothetical protein
VLDKRLNVLWSKILYHNWGLDKSEDMGIIDMQCAGAT